MHKALGFGWRRSLLVGVSRPRIRLRLPKNGRDGRPWHSTSIFLGRTEVHQQHRSMSDQSEQQSNKTNTPSNNAGKAIDDAPKGQLSIVFSDIVESTAIWENKPEAMAEAMQIHDQIIRDLVEAYKGYEVKQNGDGFMIVFPTAISALQFCLDVQQRLLEQEWPEALTKISPGEEVNDDDGNTLFRGLRLRMSAHWGAPVCVWNDVVDRMDYLGPVINRAARFIQATEGGQTVVSEEFLLEIQRWKKGDNPDASSGDGDHDPKLDLQNLQADHDPITDQRFEVRLLGEHQFEGLSEPQKLYFIIPQSLHGRLDFWPKHKHIPGSKGNIFPGSD